MLESDCKRPSTRKSPEPELDTSSSSGHSAFRERVARAAGVQGAEGRRGDVDAAGRFRVEADVVRRPDLEPVAADPRLNRRDDVVVAVDEDLVLVARNHGDLHLRRVGHGGEGSDLTGLFGGHAASVEHGTSRKNQHSQRELHHTPTFRRHQTPTAPESVTRVLRRYMAPCSRPSPRASRTPA